MKKYYVIKVIKIVNLIMSGIYFAMKERENMIE